MNAMFFRRRNFLHFIISDVLSNLEPFFSAGADTKLDFYLIILLLVLYSIWLEVLEVKSSMWKESFKCFFLIMKLTIGSVTWSLIIF